MLRTTVPRSVRISEAPSHGQTVMTYDPASSGALSYLEAARELAEQVLTLGRTRASRRSSVSEKRRGLGRGLGALIPSGTAPVTKPAGDRPVDVFFPGRGPDGVPDGAADAAAGTTATATLVEERTEPDPALAGGAAPVEAIPGLGRHDGSGDGRRRHPDDGCGAARRPGAGPPRRRAPARFRALRFAEVPVSWIRPNPRQPRQVFDEEALAELVHSVREIGVLQPVVVRPVPAAETVPRRPKAPPEPRGPRPRRSATS